MLNNDLITEKLNSKGNGLPGYLATIYKLYNYTAGKATT
jgi:hypothetical protein